MAIIIVCTLCFVNLLLWFLFFKKFKKIFSTDDIIENTRTELNRMILDVNRNAERNITLIESKISDLKAIISQADSHVSLLKSEIEKNIMADNYKSKVKSVISSSPANPSYKVNAYIKNSGPGQQSLFQTEIAGAADTIRTEEKTYNDVATENTGYLNEAQKHMENVHIANVHVAEEPIVMKKSFNQEVNERYMKGESVEEIAASLSRSVTEVQFALDMNE